MRKYLSGAILAAALATAALAATGAGAATLDFVAEANTNGERGIANGGMLAIAGVNVTFDAGTTGVAYFDKSSPAEVKLGGAGLGVCSTGLTATLQCQTPSDDNVTISEAVMLTFDSGYNLSGLKFNAEGHHALTSNKLTLLFAVNGGALSSYTFANLMTQSFSDVTSMMFAYGGDKPDQYYVSAMTVSPVPVPAAGFLLIGALGMLGLAQRRKSAV